ncbi:Methionyl-tRNA formyltransferase [Altererythrobacter insulae]|nr:Methionyl-tRNA formyltransferase [Altererythrobacter insulae]
MTSDTAWPQFKTVNVVVDPPGWFTTFAKQLVARLTEAGHTANLFEKQSEVARGDVAFYLSCTGITPPEILARNQVNLVVHASDLPKGRGFSPLAWQVFEGLNDIPVTMITMEDEVDAGDILMQRHLHFAGHELNDEMRTAMGQVIVDMCLDAVQVSERPNGRKQEGDSTWYRRRRPADSELDPQKSIAEQFNLLRIVDNESYPAFFDLQGHRYILKIERVSEES